MIDVLGLLGDDELEAESSLVLTYELHLPLYDGFIRRRLNAAGIFNQILFCDLGSYARELDGISAARRCGSRYSVTPVDQRGAFHPKVYLAVGPTRGRLLIGSGNATVGGLIRNAELFGRFDFDAAEMSAPHPSFGEVLRLASTLAECASPLVRIQLSQLRSRAPWIGKTTGVADDRHFIVGGPGRQPILDQIRAILGTKVPESALVMSASFDRRLEGMRQIASATSSGRVRCIVQVDKVSIDGPEVTSLGAVAEWYPFVDPYPSEKRARHDVFAHAKLVIFECANEELVVFGSPNASRPALVSAENTETAIAVWRPRGSVAKALGLERSLSAPEIGLSLASKTWLESEEAAESLPVSLAAVTVTSTGLSVTIARGSPPGRAVLELCEGTSRPALARYSVPETSLVPGQPPEGARVARLVDESGLPLSNFVALTYEALLAGAASASLGEKRAAAIAAMQDGVVLGTVLFELLDKVSDFDVLLAGSERRETEAADGGAPDDEQRTPESFITNARPSVTDRSALAGDFADLDVLAALVQPISRESNVRSHYSSDEDDDDDDSALEEEVDRRALDSGEEGARAQPARSPFPLASADALRRGARKIERRLQVASNSIESVLQRKRAGKVTSLPGAVIARQIWMSHIGAFLAGRRTESADGPKVLCLSTEPFRIYVLRLCRALAGGRAGGVLSLLQDAAWTESNGESLRRGIAFLWTCGIWAAATIDRTPSEEPKHLCAAVPDLVVARFAMAASPHCSGPDLEDIARRLPATGELPPGAFESFRARIDSLRDVLSKVEASEQQKLSPADLKVGGLAFHPLTGGTVVTGIDKMNVRLLDLSTNYSGDEVVLRLAKAQLADVICGAWKAIPEGILRDALQASRLAREESRS